VDLAHIPPAKAGKRVSIRSRSVSAPVTAGGSTGRPDGRVVMGVSGVRGQLPLA